MTPPGGPPNVPPGKGKSGPLPVMAAEGLSPWKEEEEGGSLSVEEEQKNQAVGLHFNWKTEKKWLVESVEVQFYKGLMAQ